MSGRSKQRNRVIAEVFNQMGLIEAWGTGLRNIRRAAADYHLPEPEFIEMPETFRVNLFRKGIAEKVDYGAGIIAEDSDEIRRSFGGTSEELRRRFGRIAREFQRKTGGIERYTEENHPTVIHRRQPNCGRTFRKDQYNAQEH